MKERKMAVHVIIFLSNRLEDSKSFPTFAIEKEKNGRMRHSAPSILQDVQTRLVLVESGKLTGYQANAVRHVLYPSPKDMGCFTIFVDTRYSRT